MKCLTLPALFTSALALAVPLHANYITSETEPNDTQTQANGPVGSGITVDGTLSSSSDIDWFYFDVAEAGEIFISLDHQKGPRNFDWYLYKETGPSVAQGTTGNNPEEGSYQASDPGRFYIEVVASSNRGGWYDLTVTFPQDSENGNGDNGGGGDDPTDSLTIENVTFHETSILSYDGDRPDEGGALFVQVRNTGTEVQDLTSESMTVNGNPITDVMLEGPGIGDNDPNGWVRVWPESIAPGEVATWTVKTFGGTIAEGNTISTIEVSSDSNDTASISNVNLDTPTLRLAHVVPSQNYGEIWVYIRNEDAAPLTITSLVLNNDVTGNTSFLGGATVEPNELVIAKVTNSENLGNGSPIAIRATGTRADESTVTVGSFLRLTEPEYGITTWGSSPAFDFARIQRLRQLYGLTGNSWGYPTGALNGADPAVVDGVNNEYGRRTTQYFYRSRILGVLSSNSDESVNLTNAEIVETLGERGHVGAWFVSDEPDLSVNSSTGNQRAIMNRSRAYWQLDPGTPTHVNLVSSRSAQGYALTVDHPALDAYMQYAPRHWGGLTQTYPIREIRDQTDNLKRGSEPLRFWMTPQGVSPGTWGEQPAPWGIAIQFWAQVMGGAKGLDGFKFDDTGDDPADPNGLRTQRQVELIQQLRLVEGLLLYGDPLNTVTTDRSSDVLDARVIASEEAVVVPVVNLDASYTSSLFGSGSITKNDQIDVSLSIPVPHWVTIDRVVEVTHNGFQPIAHTVVGNTVEIDGIDVMDARVFLIGAEDTTPPDAPTGVQFLPDLVNVGQSLLSWKQPFDSTGIMGYKVYEDGIEIADVRTPMTEIAKAPSEITETYLVRAYDGDGNLSEESMPPAIPFDWRFEQDGNTEGWAPNVDFQQFNASDDWLQTVVFDSSGDSIVNPVMVYSTSEIDPQKRDVLYVRMRNETPSSTFQLYWGDSQGGWAVDGRVESFTTRPNDPFFQEYYLDLSENPSWNLPLDSFRLDPAHFYSGTGPDHIVIDRVALLDSDTISPTWTFTQDGSPERWDTFLHQISSQTVENGVMEIEIEEGGDPFMGGPTFVASAAANPYVIIRMQNLTSAVVGELFFTTDSSPGFDGAKRVDFPLTPNAMEMEDIVIDMSSVAQWNGKITQLRLDPTAGGPAGTVLLESIRLSGSPTPNSAPAISLPITTIEIESGESATLPIPTVSDADNELTEAQITISADNGTINLQNTSTARIVAGTNGTDTFTLRGSLRALNRALAGGIIYTNNVGSGPIDEVTFLVDDLGNGQPEGPKQAIATLSVDVVESSTNDSTPIGDKTSVDDWMMMH
ncbi:MAG: PPC domain-containing protein [Candidatus Sumerlaeia bacterium]|nr:PPC domain-containing protein [Candidatus Sumerlaeia bacterium]